MDDLKDKNREELMQIILELRLEEKKLTVFLRHMVEKNKTLEQKVVDQKVELPGFNQSWDWLSKLVFIVKEFKRPLRSSEILNALLAHDPVALSWRFKDKALSSYLNKAIRYKVLLPYKKMGIRGYYYCLPEWISETGELLSAYK